MSDNDDPERFLLALGDAMRSSGSADAVIATASRLLGERLCADRIVFAEIDDDAGLAHIRQGWTAAGAETHPATLRLDDFGGPLLDDLRAGRTVRYDDIGAPPYARPDLAALAAIGIHAGLSVPLLVEDRFVLNLNVHQHTRRTWSDADVALTREVAERLWTALQRARAEDALRVSEKRQTLLLKVADALRPVDDAAIGPEAAAMRVLAQHLGADRADYLAVDTSGDRAGHRVGAAAAALLLDTGQPPVDLDKDTMDALAAGKALVIAQSVREWRREGDRNAADSRNTGSAVIVPLVRDGALRALVAISNHVPRRWSDTVLSLVEEVAERIWIAADRAALEAARSESDARFRFLFENIQEGFCICDRVDGEPFDYRFVMANPAFEQQSGLKDPVGKTMRELVPSTDEETMAHYERVISTGRSEAFSVHIAEVDRWFDIEAVATGRSGQIAILFRDISAQRRAEEKLTESEAKYRSVFEAIDEGFCILEMTYDDAGAAIDYCFVEVNPAFERQTGTAGVTGKRASEVIPGTERQWIETYADVARNGSSKRFEEFHKATGRWYDVYATPLGDPDSGRISVVINDISERRRVEAALRQSEARFRGFVMASEDSVYRMSADWREMRSLEGREFLASLNEPATDWFERYIADEDRPQVEAAIAAAIRDKATFSLEHRVRRVDGTLGWTLSRAVPMLDDAGEITEWIGAATDITARREIEETLRLTLQLVPALLWWADPAGDVISTNRQWKIYTGQSNADVQDYGWLAAVHPDDVEPTRAAFEHAFATGEPLERQQRIRQNNDGYRWHLVRHVPVRDAHGTITNWFGAAIDIHELRELQNQQLLLVAELQHRVRNVLGVIRSVFGRTIETGSSIEDVADHFRGRLDALARTQVVATQSVTGLVDLENLIRDEMLSVGARDGDGVTISGPDVALPPKVAESIGLAIHELTTNAVKYGALSVPNAKLEIQWLVNLVNGGTRKLNLSWTERGVPAVSLKPSRYGFGRELIEEALPYRLEAETKLEFRGGGVCCTISLPLPEPAAGEREHIE